MDSGRTPSEKVIHKIAEREGVEPSQLQIPLYDVVDPEALDSLITAKNRAGSNGVNPQFSYYGYDVTIESPGRIAVEIPMMERGNGTSGSPGSTVD